MSPRSTHFSSAMSRNELHRLAQIRADFLSSGKLSKSDLVDRVIQASWLRSQQLRLDAEKIDPSYLSPVDEETPLALSAAPVLRQVAEELANEPVSIILADAHGVVLQRICTDSGLVRALDGARLAPGFSYAEKHIGTNGIGTALESRAPIVVHGVEHYSSDLGAFTCAGVPVTHPISGALLGILDMTSLRQDSNPLLLVVAKSTVHRIQQQMLGKANARQLALFTDYLAACKHGGDSIVAVNQEMIMMSTGTHRYFDSDDRAALLTRLTDAEGSTKPMTMLEDLPSGLTARIEYRPAFAGQTLAGGVLRIQPTAPQIPSTARRKEEVFLPGIVGTSPIWKRTCRAVLDGHRRGEWLVLEGETGVGKLALLRGVHQLRNPSGQFSVIDASGDPEIENWLDEVSEKLADGEGTVILRRVHLLPPLAIQELSAILQEAAAHEAPGDHPWVAMTMSSRPRNAHVEAELLPYFPHSIEIPPLRHHMNDLRALVAQILGDVNRSNTVTLSPAAMNQLMRLPWRGNVEQLHRVLNRITRLRRSGIIDLDDLPAECRATTRRQLTQMEALERDAICTSLAIHHGNKDRAAEDLGMSRATIYRRIRQYGII
jgi:transcriptional regulator of acetoin/glycerol metabolism